MRAQIWTVLVQAAAVAMSLNITEHFLGFTAVWLSWLVNRIGYIVTLTTKYSQPSK